MKSVPLISAFSVQKRRFEFNLSFQQGYGIYKIPHAPSPSVEKPCYGNLYDQDFAKTQVAILSSGQITSLASCDFGKMVVEEKEECSLHGKLLFDSVSHQVRTEAQEQLNSTELDTFGKVSPAVSGCDGEDLNLDASSVFDGPERRLSHEECRKIELTDWEWCRSKSERTPRQVTSHLYTPGRNKKPHVALLSIIVMNRTLMTNPIHNPKVSKQATVKYSDT